MSELNAKCIFEVNVWCEINAERPSVQGNGRRSCTFSLISGFSLTLNKDVCD